MTLLINSAIVLFAGLVALVLLMGLTVMMRQGDMNLSQKLMRWRVGLQFVVIMLVLVAVYVTKG